MRSLVVFVLGISLIGQALAQDPVVPPRFDVIYNPELYKQDTPQDTLTSVLGAIARERYDYLVAHLLDPEFVDSRLGATQAYFERVAGEQITSTAAGATLRGPELDLRVRDIGSRLNARNLADQVRQKLLDEPDNLKDLKRFAREAEFAEAGDTATATLRDVNGRALYFKKSGDRWFLENRKTESAPPPAQE
jgi:hypothetical protein